MGEDEVLLNSYLEFKLESLLNGVYLLGLFTALIRLYFLGA